MCLIGTTNITWCFYNSSMNPISCGTDLFKIHDSWVVFVTPRIGWALIVAISINLLKISVLKNK